ncbi:MAG: hypothetical protein LKE48_03205 [Solobacterium sp.]|jgi:phage-related protein|nr:hypothetical protein [Solobacterium sp.]MCH4281512.1 hypothetical protein [Solobacterium sp.]
MASGTTLGKAYVQIMPSTEGMKANLTQLMSGDAESAGQSAGNSFAGKFKSIIASAGIAAAFAKVMQSTISEGAKLQQSYAGGVTTIYGEAADSVRGFAKEASSYGMSMNDYSEQAVSFGASLKQAYGGDAVKAANAANTAIMDMSDNQAKMGTDISSIQDAYQGFAKQNYTMLDNLKLGYGGTKTEMERLLSDAEKISGVHYDISNLGDVYSAIHVIQDNLGLTGVAAEEASTTFSGSFDAMKAAASNLGGSIAIGENVKPAFDELIKTTKTFIVDNFIPMIQQIGTSIVDLLPEQIKQLIPVIETLGAAFVGLKLAMSISSAISGASAAFGTFSTAMTAAGGGLKGLLSALSLNPFTIIIAAIAGAVAALVILYNNSETFRAFVGELWAQIQSFVAWITPIVTTVVDSIISGVQSMLSACQPIIDAMIQAFKNAFDMICAIWDFFAPYFQAKWDAIVTIFTPVAETLGNFFQTAWTVIQDIWSVVADFFATIWNTIAGIFKVVEDVFRGDFSGAWDAIKDIVGHWGDFFSNTWNSISNIFDAVTGFFSGVFQGAWDGICNVWNGAGDFFGGVWGAISGWFTALPGNALQWGQDMIQGFIDGIGDMIGGIGDAIGNVVGTITDFLHFSKPDKGPLREYEKWMPDFIGGLASGIDNNSYKITDAMKSLTSDMSIGTDITGSVKQASVSSESSAALLNGSVPSSVSDKASVTSSNTQSVVINVYPPENSNNKEIAEYVMDEMQKKTKRKETVFG